MKVLLKRDVKGLGERGEVHEVANGYAVNYLIPRELAMRATPGVLKEHERQMRIEARKQKEAVQSAEEQAEAMRGIVLTFTARAGENDRLYGSITSGDIASGLEMETGQSVDKRNVLLDQPIRELGEHVVPVKLMTDVVPEITVVVEAEAEEA
jgi:large subunit ribosomal protein L9